MKRGKTEKPAERRERTSLLGWPDRLNQSDIARACGVTPQAVSRWKDCPRNPDGTYSLPQVYAYIELRGEARGRAARSEDEGEATASARKRALECTRIEMDIAQAAGALVVASVVADRWSRVFAMLRQRFEGLAPRIAPRLVGLEVGEIAAELAREVDDTMDEFRAAYERETAEDEREARKS